MKRVVLALFAVILSVNTLFSPGKLSAQDWSGVMDSTVNYTNGAGDAQTHSFGLEQYVNLRLRVRAGQRAVFFSAFNLIALSGNYAENAAMLETVKPDSSPGSTAIVYGQNYAAALELERLYFRINGDHIDTEAGLLRIPFGYGQVWGSMDFLNPRNPLHPNARPRGVLGLNFSYYPTDSLKLMFFAAAPKNPLNSDGGGFIPGFSLNQHWDRLSLQALYAFETPRSTAETSGLNEDSLDIHEKGIHRFGLSLKADFELGFVAEALYTLDPDNAQGIDGLSLGAGFDYNFLKGDLYVLMEYLYNGFYSSTAPVFGGSWTNHHYLYGTILYHFNDYCNLSLSTVFCFDDLSFSPFVTLYYEVFQGFSLSLSARLPMDQKTMNGGKAGELGPIPPYSDGRGTRFIVNLGAKLRF
jgi:hypothetical protein